MCTNAVASPGFGVRGARRSRRRRREHRGAKDAEWGGYGEGCPLPSRLRVWGSVVSSPSWVRGGSPAALSHFLHILGHRTLLVARKIRFSCPKYKKKLVFFVIFHFEKNGGDSHRQTESVLKRRRHQTPGGGARAPVPLPGDANVQMKSGKSVYEISIIRKSTMQKRNQLFFGILTIFPYRNFVRTTKINGNRNGVADVNENGLLVLFHKKNKNCIIGL